MVALTSSITWNSPTADMWRLFVEQNPSDPNNLGIPEFPYVYKAYLSLETLSPLLDSFTYTYTDDSQNIIAVAEEDYPTIVRSHIRSLAQYVRPVLPSDLTLDNIDTLSSEILSKVTINPYTDSTDSTGLLTYAAGDTPDTIVPVSTGLNYSRLSRDPSTEHTSLDGWYYFRDDHADKDYFVYDRAQAALSNLEYLLGWRTKQESGSTYLPLTAGILSVIPSSRQFSVGSSSATGLLAGDYVRITVSGGSGEYTITPNADSASHVAQESSDTWRVLSNASNVLVLEITDNNIDSRVTITLVTTEP